MKKILLAVDGSDYSTAAAQFVSRLPQQDKLEVTVLTVIQGFTVLGSSAALGWLEEVLAHERSSAIETYERIKQTFGNADVAIHHEIREGHPDETIVRTAEELAADLIVLGARGQTKVSRILLGSTSDYVATHAPCSVMVIRSTQASDVDRPLRIAIGCDESEPAQAALAEFAEIPWGSGVEVHVVSVLCCLFGFFDEISLDSQGGSNLETVKKMHARLNEAVKQLREAAPVAQPHLIEFEHVGEGLVQFVKDYDCDLIVVGETPQSYLGKMLLGSVSRFVLRHASCSVWITRNRMSAQP